VAGVENCPALFCNEEYINSLVILGKRAFAEFSNFMKWLKRIGIVLGVLLLIFAVVPLLIALDDYIPAIETEVSARIKATSVTAASVPLNVSGTLDSPLLYPTGGTMAGAAAGTAVLGPVVGTAVGAKVGQWFENLFGKKDEAKK
jgi:hypothetical protein